MTAAGMAAHDARGGDRQPGRHRPGRRFCAGDPEQPGARIFLTETAWFSFIGNGFLAGMAYFACRGAMLRHIGRPSDFMLLPILAITLLAGLWFGFVHSSILARGTVTSLGAAAMIILTARAMLKADDRDTVGILTAVAFCMTAALLIGRPVMVYFLEGAVSSEAEVTGSWWGISFRFLAMLSFVSVAILFLHRIATDLLNEIKGRAHTDYLTGVLNRGGFFSQVETGDPYDTFAIMICDIDEFKHVNDTYGHKVGDTVIQDLAKVMTDAARPFGYIVGRLGGDEFVVMMPGAHVIEARAFAERICKSFAAISHHRIAQSDSVTISIGVAIAFSNEPLDSALEHADAALYRAKRKGKNCTEVAALPISDTPSPISSTYRRRRQA